LAARDSRYARTFLDVTGEQQYRNGTRAPDDRMGQVCAVLPPCS
jgi:hypothetical protein